MPSCLDAARLGVFESDQLESEPKAVDKVRPSFPVEARQRRTKGIAIVHGVVRSDGRFTDLCSAVAVPRGYGFEEAALEALGRWRWKPGRKDGAAVDSLVAVTVRWDVH